MRIIKLLALFSLSILLGACGGGGSSGTITTPVPGGSVTTTLSLDKLTLDSSLTEQDKITVTAEFYYNGQPIVGMPVEFSATSGYVIFSPLDAKVTTDASGKATILMFVKPNPPSDGVAQVTFQAVYNGVKIEPRVQTFYTNQAALKLANPVPEKSQLTAGLSTTVSVQVLDASGNPYATPSGLDVYFSAEHGGFIADNMVGKVRTNSAGVARVTYVPPYSVSTPVTDTITATLGSSVVRTTITVSPRLAANIQYSTAVPAKTTFGYNQPVTLSYKVTDSQGTAIPNVNVTFSNAGSVIGTDLSDVYGYATVTFTTASTPSVFWITASLADGTSAQSAVFSVTASGLSLGIAPVTPTVATSMAFNSSLPVSFKVTDASGTAVAGQAVTLSVIDSVGNPSQAATLKDIIAVTNAQGIVSANLVSSTTAANLWVKATLTSDPTIFVSSGTITIQSGSLALAIAPSTPRPGDSVTATVTYTNASAASLAGQSITIVSNNPAVIATNTYSGVTDNTGKATIVLPVEPSATQNTVVTLYATGGGTVSPTTILTVGAKTQDAAKLTLSMGDTASWTLPNSGVVVQGNKATFVTSQGIPIVGQPVTFTIDRVDGWTSVNDPHVTLDGIPFTQSATPTTATPVTLKTDTTGTVLIPTIIEGTNVGHYVIYWRAKATNSGIDYLAYGSTMVTVSPTPMSIAGSVAFASTDGKVASTVKPTVSGGFPDTTGEYFVSSNNSDITVPSKTTNKQFTVTKTIDGFVAPATGIAATATIIVTDSIGTQATLNVTYYK